MITNANYICQVTSIKMTKKYNEYKPHTIYLLSQLDLEYL